MDHLERFEDLVSAIKANGVHDDYLFWKLFKYSLAGDALYWLKNGIEIFYILDWYQKRIHA